MAEINLMDQYPRSKRPIEERGARKLSGEGWLHIDTSQLSQKDIYFQHLLLKTARKFGKEYFDGDRLYGYGGYYYDQKYWTGTVKRLRDYYRLSDDASVLDVGCAKGFLMHDFKQLMPDLNIAGVDISSYAYDHAIEAVKPYIQIANVKKLPYPDRSFDLVVSINTVDHLPLAECKQAISEVQRVTCGHSFITVNAWRNDKEKENLLKWNLTALTSLSVEDWKKLFDEVGYQGDYYWFIAS